MAPTLHPRAVIGRSMNYLEFLHTTCAQNTVLEWLTAATTGVLAALAVRLMQGLTTKYVGRLVTRTSHQADDVLLDVVCATHWFSYVAVALFAGGQMLTLGDDVSNVLAAVLAIALFVQVGIWAQVLTKSLVGRWVQRRGDNQSSTMAAGIAFVARLVIWTGVVLMILANLGVDITAVVAGLGVGGVAAALAVQGVLSDLFASLSMYFDRPFDIGDFIIVDDYMGTVEKVGLRTSRIASLGGEQLIFANSDLVKSRIRNYARMKERRVVFGFGIEYGHSAQKVERAATIAREVIEGTSDTRLDRVHFKAYGAYALDYEAVYYVLSPDYTLYMQRQHEINVAIYRRFEQEGISFAFPTQTLHIHREGAREPGYRAAE